MHLATRDEHFSGHKGQAEHRIVRSGVHFVHSRVEFGAHAEAEQIVLVLPTVSDEWHFDGEGEEGLQDADDLDEANDDHP